jgi:DNA polymerase III epsilon subunit-like protein
MKRFSAWANELASQGETLVFVGFNAPFDWSFVNYYFHKYLGRNPFGFTALYIKAYYMGDRLHVVANPVQPSVGRRQAEAAWRP